MTILELFPTPVLVTQLPAELGYIVDFFYAQEMTNGGEEVDSANYGERSKNTYILDEEPCKDVKEFILNACKKFGEQLGYDYEEYKLSQSWLSFKHPGQHHTMHTHPNSLISGVFYFGESDDKTPAIKFHNPIFGLNVSYIYPKMIKDKEDKKYAMEFLSINFEAGLLILFPSYLHHSVPLNKTDKTRCSLAFNVVSAIGFGDEKNLTELKF
jgi:uncharacterized protein (TIGR02466 family)